MKTTKTEKTLRADRTLADKLPILKVVTGKEVKDLTDEAIQLLINKYKPQAKKSGYLL